MYVMVTDTSQVTVCEVDEYEQILVRKGDFIGWYVTLQTFFEYLNCICFAVLLLCQSVN